MSDLVGEVRYSVRSLLRSRPVTITALVTLALGIGLNTAIFSLVKSLFFDVVPVAEPEELVAIYTTDEKNPGYLQVSWPNYLDIREQTEALSDVLAYQLVGAHISDGDAPRVEFGLLVTSNYFELLGVEPVRGRSLRLEDHRMRGSNAVMVLSYDFWHGELGGAPDVLGRVIQVNGRPFAVVGVAPPGFTGTDLGFRPSFWVPVSMYETVLPTRSAEFFEERRALHLNLVGRLAEGAGLQQARVQLATIGARLAQEHPEENRGRGMAVVPFLDAMINPNVKQGVTLVSGLLLAITGIVLLIACINVAGLLLARTAARRHEIGVRLCIGATRGRLVRQLLMESLLLSMGGALLGLLLAAWLPRFLWSLLPALPIPVALDFGLDLRVLGFTLVVAVVVALTFGLVPAIQGSQRRHMAALKGEAEGGAGPGGGRMTLRKAAVVGQIGLSLLSVLVATLFVRSLQEARHIDVGFDAERLAVLTLSPDVQGYAEAEALGYFDRLRREVGSMPEVESVALASNEPLGGGLNRTVVIEGQGSESDGILVPTNDVDDHYFATLGISIVRGRGFSEFDREDTRPVAVVNETLAERFWPDRDPLGERFRFFDGEASVEVIGVAEDCKYSTLGEPSRPFIYLALRQNYPEAVALHVRVSGNPAAALPAISRAVRSLDPDMPLITETTVLELIDRSLWGARMGAAVLGFFGLLSLVMAAVGVYGILAFSVHRRRTEIGVRMALGASVPKVLGMMLRQGMLLVSSGIVLGALCALAATRGLSSLLYGVSTTDPAAFAGSMAVLAAVAFVSIFIPARRAAQTHPAAALRSE